MRAMSDSVSIVASIDVYSSLSLPLAGSRISCGFPSAAEDWIEDQLDLNERLVKSPPSTFLFRVEGESMTGVGINDGDLLIVDRAIKPKHGKVVVASVHGDMTVKKLDLKSSPPRLLPANKFFRPITDEFTVWGVVTSSITEF